ncbi:circadian clock KaiB family protein [Luteolibacter yonseiensis]|uniref:Circadian clock KaiB family protein n=1 Tax=Luteolibacter yonseiensis TaxID=1144680 RepID=A0A934V8N0_9BACT|nr:circadian clock KaiB family protein [Luteolibacter yonseiensis]MBK1817432.1 circadian clock KaiB family protein [Luteolibacter yonseiensis]
MNPAEFHHNVDPAEVDRDDSWQLILFVAGQSPKSLMAYSNLRKVCDSHLAGRHNLRLVDLAKEPAMAKLHKIVAIPTLVRETPSPAKRIIGSLSNIDKLLHDLDLGPAVSFPNTLT